MSRGQTPVTYSDPFHIFQSKFFQIHVSTSSILAIHCIMTNILEGTNDHHWKSTSE